MRLVSAWGGMPIFPMTEMGNWPEDPLPVPEWFGLGWLSTVVRQMVDRLESHATGTTFNPRVVLQVSPWMHRAIVDAMAVEQRFAGGLMRGVTFLGFPVAIEATSPQWTIRLAAEEHRVVTNALRQRFTYTDEDFIPTHRGVTYDQVTVYRTLAAVNFEGDADDPWKALDIGPDVE